MDYDCMNAVNAPIKYFQGLCQDGADGDIVVVTRIEDKNTLFRSRSKKGWILASMFGSAAPIRNRIASKDCRSGGCRGRCCWDR